MVGRCLTKKNKPCKGKLKKRFTKSNARGNFRVKALEMKRYPAGSKLEFIITNPRYFTQIKIMTIKRNADPAIGTRCQTPGQSRRPLEVVDDRPQGTVGMVGRPVVAQGCARFGPEPLS